nr:hypothetical protein 4 [Saccharospirillaceae bacterium]
MSLQALKPSFAFHDQIKVLALVGYAELSQVIEEDLYPVARAWLIENADLQDRDDRLTRAVPISWTRSVIQQVIQWPMFRRDCDAALVDAFNRAPFELAIELWFSRGGDQPDRTAEQGGNVIPFPSPLQLTRHLGGPAA